MPRMQPAYPDDTLAFCLADGSLLSASYEQPQPTIASAQIEYPTEVIPSHLLPKAPKVQRNSGSKYIAVALLCLLVGGGAVAFIMSGSGGSSDSGGRQVSNAAQVAQTPKNGSPTATARAFYDAAKAKDVQGIKDTVSKGSLNMMTEFAKAQNKTLDQALREPSSSESPPAFEAQNEKITGDTATLEVKDEKGRWVTLPFVKEAGEWKIALDKSMQQGANANASP
jgi:spore germination protein GerM